MTSLGRVFVDRVPRRDGRLFGRAPDRQQVDEVGRRHHQRLDLVDGHDPRRSRLLVERMSACEHPEPHSPHRRSRFTHAAGGLLLACGLMLTVTPSAPAADIFITGPSLSYEAEPGESNNVELSLADDGRFEFFDPGATIAAPAECEVMDAGAHRVRCPADGLLALTFALRDANDRLTLDDSASPPSDSAPITADGGAGSDTLLGAAGNEQLSGGSGADVIVGGGGDDFIAGGRGDPLDAAPDTRDRLDGGPGNDFMSGGAGADVLSGQTGDDRVNGGDGDGDEVSGGPGADDVVGGAGNDHVLGGDGDDEVDVGAPDNEPPDPSVLRGSDRLDGGPGDDRIGVGPAEPLEPDVLRGGAGVDEVSYADRLTPVLVSADGLPGDGEAGEGDNVLADVERIVGGQESDSLSGSGAANQLDGGPGDDLLVGLGGDDVLNGGANDAGSDGIDGGPGRDSIQGGPGDDSVTGGADDDDVHGGGGSDAVAGDDGADQLAGGPGLDAVTGGEGNDVLRGGEVVLIGADGADDLDAGPGDDTIAAGPGNDRLDGGPGADVLGGEGGRDTLSYVNRGQGIVVTFDGLANDGEPGEGDNVASDIEAVVGGAVDDTLQGDQRENALSGGSGEDLLRGGSGQDMLSGGSASDVVRARDGGLDIVNCGSARDLAIVDRGDTARGCEFVDEGAGRRPALGRAIVVRRARGRAAFRLPRASRYTTLGGALRLPVGTTIDSKAGRVRLITARRAGRRQTAVFRGGAFSVRQRRRPNGAITVVRLRGGDFRSCRPSPTAPATAVAAASRRRVVRRVWGRGHGRYRTRGRWSSAAVRGTTWLTEDRCDGTLTRVLTGTVVVRDFRLRRTVVVEAGEEYLARAPRR